MKMVSMKNKPKKGGKDGGEMADCGSDEMYPWGTSISLGDDQLEALGIKDLPKVGTVLTIQARVEVCGVNSRKDQDGSADNNLNLQITDMGIDAGGMSESEKAQAMFGESSK